MIFSKPHRRYDPVAEIEDYEDYYSGIELTEEQEHKVRQLVHENLPKILHDSYLVLCEETIAIVEEDMKEFKNKNSASAGKKWWENRFKIKIENL